eukprot:m.53221 g.53221  ORF g.53221 m.53221 type:complete len:2690 (+) comp11359_c0_seq1:133-8202(+)
MEVQLEAIDGRVLCEDGRSRWVPSRSFNSLLCVDSNDVVSVYVFEDQGEDRPRKLARADSVEMHQIKSFQVRTVSTGPDDAASHDKTWVVGIDGYHSLCFMCFDDQPLQFLPDMEPIFNESEVFDDSLIMGLDASFAEASNVLSHLKSVATEQDSPLVSVASGVAPRAKLRRIVEAKHCPAPSDMSLVDMAPSCTRTAVVLLGAATVVQLQATMEVVSVVGVTKLLSDHIQSSFLGAADAGFTTSCADDTTLSLLTKGGVVLQYHLLSGQCLSVVDLNTALIVPRGYLWSTMAVDWENRCYAIGCSTKSAVVTIDLDLYHEYFPTHKASATIDQLTQPQILAEADATLEGSTVVDETAESTSSQSDGEELADDTDTETEDEGEDEDHSKMRELLASDSMIASAIRTDVLTSSMMASVATSTDKLNQLQRDIPAQDLDGVANTWFERQLQQLQTSWRAAPEPTATPVLNGYTCDEDFTHADPEWMLDEDNLSRAHTPPHKTDQEAKPCADVFEVRDGTGVESLVLSGSTIIASLRDRGRGGTGFASAVLIVDISNKEYLPSTVSLKEPNSAVLSFLPVCIISSSSISTVVGNLSQQQLLNQLHLLEQTTFATNLCALNGWSAQSLSCHQLKTCLKFNNVDGIPEAFEAVPDQQLEDACKLIEEYLNKTITSNLINASYIARAVKHIATKRLEILKDEPTAIYLAKLLAFLRTLHQKTSAAVPDVIQSESESSGTVVSRSFPQEWQSMSDREVFRQAIERNCISQAQVFVTHRRKQISVASEAAALYREQATRHLLQERVMDGEDRVSLQSQQSNASSQPHASSFSPLDKSTPSSQHLFSASEKLEVVRRIALEDGFKMLKENELKQGLSLMHNLGFISSTLLTEVIPFTCDPELRKRLITYAKQSGVTLPPNLITALASVAKIESLYQQPVVEHVIAVPDRHPIVPRLTSYIRLQYGALGLKTSHMEQIEELLSDAKLSAIQLVDFGSELVAQTLSQDEQGLVKGQADGQGHGGSRRRSGMKSGLPLYSQLKAAWVESWDSITVQRILHEGRLISQGTGAFLDGVTPQNAVAAWQLAVYHGLDTMLAPIAKLLQTYFPVSPEKNQYDVHSQLHAPFDVYTGFVSTRELGFVGIANTTILTRGNGRQSMRHLARIHQLFSKEKLALLPVNAVANVRKALKSLITDKQLLGLGWLAHQTLAMQWSSEASPFSVISCATDLAAGHGLLRLVHDNLRCVVGPDKQLTMEASPLFNALLDSGNPMSALSMAPLTETALETLVTRDVLPHIESLLPGEVVATLRDGKTAPQAPEADPNPQIVFSFLHKITGISSKFFEWHYSQPMILPAMHDPSLQRHASKYVLDLEYYLQQGRPIHALHDEQIGVKPIPKRTLLQLHHTAITSIDPTTFASSTVLYLSQTKQLIEAEYFRLHVQVAERILQHNATLVGKRELRISNDLADALHRLYSFHLYGAAVSDSREQDVDLVISKLYHATQQLAKRKESRLKTKTPLAALEIGDFWELIHRVCFVYHKPMKLDHVSALATESTLLSATMMLAHVQELSIPLRQVMELVTDLQRTERTSDDQARMFEHLQFALYRCALEKQPAMHTDLLQPFYNTGSTSAFGGRLSVFDAVAVLRRHATVKEIPLHELLLGVALRYNNPFMAVLALCYVTDKPALCMSVWLALTLQQQQRQMHHFSEVKYGSEVVDACDIDTLVQSMEAAVLNNDGVPVLPCQSFDPLDAVTTCLLACVVHEKYDIAMEAFAVFDNPSAVFVNLFRFLGKAQRLRNAATELEAFTTTLNGVGLPTTLGSKEWMNATVSKLLHVAVTSCVSDSQQQHLRKACRGLLDDQEATEVYMSGVNIPQELRHDPQKLVTYLTGQGKFKEAVDAAESHKTDVTLPLLELNLKLLEDVCGTSLFEESPATRMHVLESIHKRFEQSPIQHRAAALFFVSELLGQKLSAHDLVQCTTWPFGDFSQLKQHTTYTLEEKHKVLEWAATWLTMPAVQHWPGHTPVDEVAAANLKDTVLCWLWLVRIELQDALFNPDTQTFSSTVPFSCLTERHKEWQTLDMWRPLVVQLPLSELSRKPMYTLEPHEERALSPLLHRLFEFGDVEQVLQLVQLFGFQPDDTIICYIMLRILPDTTLAPDNVELALKHLNIALTDLSVLDALKKLLERMDLAKPFGIRVVVNFEASLRLQQPYYSFFEHPPMKILRHYLGKDGAECLDFAHAFVSANKLNPKNLAIALSDFFTDNISSDNMSDATTMPSAQKNEHWCEWSDRTFVHFASLSELCLVGKQLITKSRQHQGVYGAPEDLIHHFYVETELLARAYTCYFQACDVQGLATVRKHIGTCLQTFPQVAAGPKGAMALARLLRRMRTVEDGCPIVALLVDMHEFETAAQSHRLVNFCEEDRQAYSAMLLGCVQKLYPNDAMRAQQASVGGDVVKFAQRNVKEGDSLLTRAMDASNSKTKRVQLLLQAAEVYCDAANIFLERHMYQDARKYHALIRLIALQAQTAEQIVNLAINEVPRVLQKWPDYEEAEVILHAYEAQSYGELSLEPGVFEQAVLRGSTLYWDRFKERNMLKISLFSDLLARYKRWHKKKTSPTQGQEVTTDNEAVTKSQIDRVTNCFLHVFVDCPNKTALYQWCLQAKSLHPRFFEFSKGLAQNPITVALATQPQQRQPDGGSRAPSSRSATR